jgi:probable rRNA maturation factor
MPEVEIRAEGGHWPTEALRREALLLLDRTGLHECELSIVLCTDDFIRPLNRDWRGKDQATDVLSFSQREGEEADEDDPVLGDVVISVETAARQAGDLGHGLDLELRVLLIHGLLHLLGYDHEESAEEALLMGQKERWLLGLLDPAASPEQLLLTRSPGDAD